MKTFFNLLNGDIQRSLFSFRSLGAVISYVLITFITLFDEFPYFQSGYTSVTYIYQLIQNLDFHIIYVLIGTIPGALLFCNDWDNRFFRLSVVRSTKRKYAISKVIACFFSAICIIAACEISVLILLGAQFPLVNDLSPLNVGIYNEIAKKSVVLYWGIKILFEGLCAGFLSVFALWLSTKITNIFVVLATPLLAYYLFSTISFALNTPAWLNISYLSKGYVLINDNLLFSFCSTVAIFAISTILWGHFFVIHSIMRIENG